MITQHYKFQLEPLPYSYDALEPYIDAETVRIHHNKHVQTYVDNLNKALEPYPQFHNWPLDVLLYNLDMLPEAIRTPVRNNGGGVYNHDFYFKGMTKPNSEQPMGLLAAKILIDFGSYDNFKKLFKEKALSVFGSGYAWLTVNKNGELKIVTTANQDTTLELDLCPILNIDVWEHAYYLKYQNLRANYIDNWFNLINWRQAERNYNSCRLIWSIRDNGDNL